MFITTGCDKKNCTLLNMDSMIGCWK